jgi:hypothetical protein
VSDPNGSAQEVLAGVHSDERFPVRDGIPLLYDKSKVSGFNQQYQGFYDRIAGGYDGAIKLFASGRNALPGGISVGAECK